VVLIILTTAKLAMAEMNRASRTRVMLSAAGLWDMVTVNVLVWDTF